MDAIWSALQTLPGGPFPWLCGLLGAGLLLWLAGHKVLKASFAAVGFVGGFFAGFMLAAAFDVGVPGWLAGIVMAMAMAVMASLTYKMAVATGCAIALGTLMPMAAVALHNHGMLGKLVDRMPPMPSSEGLLPLAPPPGESESGPGAGETADSEEELSLENIQRIIKEAQGELDALTAEAEDASWLTRASGWSTDTATKVHGRWEQTPPPMRTLLVGAAAVGAFLGFAGGLLATTWAAMLATAIVGGAAIMIGGAGLAQFLSGSPILTEPSHFGALAAVWTGISCLGLVIQAKVRSKRADKNV
jgi:hypothetical protein